MGLLRGEFLRGIGTFAVSHGSKLFAPLELANDAPLVGSGRGGLLAGGAAYMGGIAIGNAGGAVVGGKEL